MSLLKYWRETTMSSAMFGLWGFSCTLLQLQLLHFRERTICRLPQRLRAIPINKVKSSKYRPERHKIKSASSRFNLQNISTRKVTN